MDMTQERWTNTCTYLDDVFGRADEHLETLMERAIAEGIPDIAVSSSVGRFLNLLALMSGARTIVEVGTLAGYSGIWLARALRDNGRLITIEPNELHANFAQRMFDEAKVSDRTDIRRSTGLDELPKLVEELGPNAVDVVFLDAIKTEYPDYMPHARTLLRPGGLLIADNVLGAGWWIDMPEGENPSRDAADRFNRMVVDDPAFDTACVPIREGVLVARKR
jgi:predicted O-methyltransferase YrrM